MPKTVIGKKVNTNTKAVNMMESLNFPLVEFYWKEMSNGTQDDDNNETD